LDLRVLGSPGGEAESTTSGSEREGLGSGLLGLREEGWDLDPGSDRGEPEFGFPDLWEEGGAWTPGSEGGRLEPGSLGLKEEGWDLDSRIKRRIVEVWTPGSKRGGLVLGLRKSG
jgi:hypothetical protein